MKARLFILFSMLQVFVFAQAPVENYTKDSASIVHAGVPKGEVLKFRLENSKIYPGTWREYSIYVPAQYNPDKPACVYINQDGIQNNAPVVFDNLINSKEMPVTIGVFITPGQVKPDDPANANVRFNRSYEYDGLGDAYARFILNEVLPEVEMQKTSDGRPIRLSKSGNDRAIGGSSSGAIAAFTAAWERPNEFSRVFSTIGTYVGLRGGESYSTWIRRFEPKPLRVFLQDGSGDQNSYAGDWFFANQMMERSLVFAGYEVQHVWGEGGHNGKQAEAVFPGAMRWLWKDYPKPIIAGRSKNPFLNELLIPNEGWELVSDGYGFTEGSIANAAGEVYFQDYGKSKSYKIGLDGKVSALDFDPKKAGGTSIGPDGKRYTVATAKNQVLSYDLNGKESVVAEGFPVNDLVAAKNGNIYVTSPDGYERPSKLYLIKPDGTKIIVDEGLKFANGLALTPDQTQLYVAEAGTHWLWIFQIKPDGTLANRQRYGWLFVPDIADNSGADGLKCDRSGKVYVATRLGVQILDQTGKVYAILPMPGGQQPANLCFGGANFDTLYVMCRDKVYRRKLNTRGANTFEAPNKPANPSL
jgi:gluconolactonase